MIACNAAMALAEFFAEEGGESIMLCDFEAMHDVGRAQGDEKLGIFRLFNRVLHRVPTGFLQGWGVEK